MSSISALATSCRACLKEALEPYFQMNEQCYFSLNDENFGDIFNFCTHLQLNDEWPQRICLLCVQDLRKTYDFLQRVFDSNKKLLEWNNGRVKEVVIDNTCGSSIDPLENVTDNEDVFNSVSKALKD